jgi:thiol-disulfide isomerase/thioredoxin
MAGPLLGLLLSNAQAAGTLQPFDADDLKMNFSLTDLKGTTRTLDEFRGKVVVINFWASWCVPCVTEMPGMQRLQDALEAQPFEILAINVSESENRVREFIKRMKLNMTILLDLDRGTFEAWQGKVLPTSFLLDRTGKIRYQVTGPIEWDGEEAGKIIEALIQHPSPE